MVNIPNSNPSALIKITSLVNGKEVSFFPYDFEFDDTFKPDWGTYDGFGRMDPIMTYKRTSRSVNLSFNVVAENAEMARDNFQKLNLFISSLYPDYKSEFDIGRLDELERNLKINKTNLDRLSLSPHLAITEQLNQNNLIQEIQKIENDITNQQTLFENNIEVMQKSPLFKISFMNLLNNQNYIIAITGFKHKMKFDAADTSFSKDGNAIPGEFNINMSFTVLHNYTPGEIDPYRLS